LHRDHTVGEVVALVDRTRAAALIAKPGYGADANRYDVFAELADRAFLRSARAMPRRSPICPVPRAKWKQAEMPTR
jgi:hypothetical protein